MVGSLTPRRFHNDLFHHGCLELIPLTVLNGTSLPHVEVLISVCVVVFSSPISFCFFISVFSLMKEAHVFIAYRYGAFSHLLIVFLSILTRFVISRWYLRGDSPISRVLLNYHELRIAVLIIL